MITIANVKSRAGTFFLLVLLIPLSFASAEMLDDVLSMDVVVHIVDVGIGDAIFIELPDPEHEVVIDGGDRRQGFDFSKYVEGEIDNPIELVVVSHSDYDHWSGIENLIKKEYRVQELWDAGYNRDCKFAGARGEKKKRKDQYLRFVQRLKQLPGLTLRRPVPVNPVHPLFELDGVQFTVLHADANPPRHNECSYTVNDASVVIRMQYKNVVFLFTGDANGKERNERPEVEPSHVEAKLLALEKQHPGILKADVLKVPHHGSETANTNQFIHAVAPRVAVISSSTTARYQLPAPRVLQRYQRARFNRTRPIEKVLRTNYGEGSFETRKFGEDHILCGTNGEPDDIICDYIWNFDR